mmetsp:Transcript_5218/g.7951  ORF Transcript_5218/g.7951 Transcript_5218/m.7951 type:complete len:694 (-) Transcript_5218:12-2093(-)
MTSSSSYAPPPPRHAWSQASESEALELKGSRTAIADVSSTNEELLSDILGGGSHNGSIIIVSPFEADTLVANSIQPFSVEEVGSDAFLLSYGYDFERLSMQAHATAAVAGEGNGGGDEYVVESILAHDKLHVLVRTLLAVEAWRTHVLYRSDEKMSSSSSSLAPLAAKNGNSLRCAFTLHVETTIVGMLNLILYRREGCEALNAEVALALVDYCARSMASLAIPLSQNEMLRKQKQPKTPTQLRQRMQHRTPLDEIHDANLDSQYKTSVASVSLARYLCEHIESLHLSAQTRILDTHDYLVMLVPLIDEPPWTRRRRQIESSYSSSSNNNEAVIMVWEKLKENHNWEKVDPVDLLKVTKCEAQCWIALFHLTTTPLCRERYGLNAFRKEQLLKLRKFLTDVMLDQLPILADVRRYMDELTLLTVPENVTGHGSALLLQQVDSIREDIVSQNNSRSWDDVVHCQYDGIFSKVTDATDKALRRISEVYNIDGIENVLAVVGGNVPPRKQNEEVDESSSVEEEEDIVSKPLESVLLCVEHPDKEESISQFECKPLVGDDGTTTQTPNGLFRRMKMEICQINAADDYSTNGIQLTTIPSNSTLVANIFFGNGKHSIELQCDDVNLPSVSKENVNGDDSGGKVEQKSRPAKVWRQIGSIQERIVVQIGFKLVAVSNCEGSDETYVIDQVFVSQSAEKA